MIISDTIDLQNVVIWMEALGRKAIADAAEHLKERTIEQAPEDTGFLKSSIIVSMSSKESDISVNVGAFYAHYVEFGHLTVNGGFVPPNPFFARAFQDTCAAFPGIAQTAVATIPYGGNETGDTFTAQM